MSLWWRYRQRYLYLSFNDKFSLTYGHYPLQHVKAVQLLKCSFKIHLKQTLVLFEKQTANRDNNARVSL